MSAPPKLVVVPFEELELGRSYGPFSYAVSREQSDNLRGEVGFPRAGAHMSPGVSTMLFLWAFSDAMGGIPPGGVLLKYEVDFRDDLPSAGEVVARVRIGGKEVKRGRPRAAIDISISGSEGPPVVEGRMVIGWASVEEQRASL
jgi:hypothetical protein